MMQRGAPDGFDWTAPVGLRGIGGSLHYSDDLVLPANTSITNPVILSIETVAGWVAQISLLFPPGPAGLAHVQVWNGGEQLYPSGANQSFHPDNQLVTFLCDFDVAEIGGVYSVQFVGWNNDDTWSHTVQVHLWIIPY